MADGLVTIAVELQDGSVVKGVANINKGMTGLEQTGGRAGKSMIGFGAVTGAAMALAQKGLSAVTNSVGAAVDRFDTLNQYPKVMKQMGYSTEDTSKSIDIMKKGIDGLPTTLPEITKMSQNFATLTGSATKGSKSAVALSHAFLASGASAADASRGTQQFSQMLASGKVDMQSWQSLQETMPYALDKTAKAMGFTGKAAKQDLYKALQDGDVTMDQFLDKIIELDQGVDGFGETAKLSSKGIKTSFQNMNNAVVAGLADMLKAIDDSLKSAGLNDGIATIFDEMKSIIVIAFTSLNSFIKTTLPPIIMAMKEMFDFVANNKDWLVPLTIGVGATIGSLKLLIAVMKTFNQTQELMLAFRGMQMGAKGAGDAFALLSREGGLVARSLSGVLQAKQLVPVLWGIARGSTAAQSALVMLAQHSTMAAGASKLMGAALAVPVWGWIAAAVIGVVSALTYFIAKTEIGQKIWHAFTSWFMGVWDSMKSAVMAFATWYITIWKSIVDIGRQVLEDYFSWYIGIWKSIINAAQTMWDSFTSWFANSWESTKSGYSSFSNWFVTSWGHMVEASKSAWGTFSSWSSALFIQAMSAIQTALVPVQNAFNTFSSFVGRLATSFGQFLESIAPTGGIFANMNGPLGTAVGLITKFAPLIITLIAPVGMVAKLLLQFASALLQTGDASSAITLMADNFTSMVTGVLNGLTTMIETITAVLPQVIETGVEIIVALIEGIVSALPQIIDAMTKVIEMITTVLSDVLPQLIDAGIQILEGLIQGIVDALPQITTAILQVVTTLLDVLSDALPMLIAAGLMLIMKLAEGLMSAYGQLIKAGLDIVAKLFEAIVQALPKIIEAGIQIISKLLEAVSLALPTLIEAGLQIVTGIFDAIIQALPMLIEAGILLLTTLIDAVVALLPLLIETGLQIIMALVDALITNLPKIIDAGIQLIMALINAIITLIPVIIDAAVKIVIALVMGLITNLPKIIEAGVKLIMALAGAIITLVPLLLQAGVKLISALIRGVLSLFGALLGAGGQLISGLISAIVGFIGNMVSSGAQLISGVIDGIAGKIGNVVTTVSGGISDAVEGVKGFAGDMFNAAADLANGLVNGITSKIGEVVDAAKNMAKGAVDGAKSFLGIHSPSRVFRDQVGKFIPEGLAVGIDRNARVAVASMESLSDKISSIKPEPVFDMGAMGGFTTANGIIEHQLSRNASVFDDKTGNVANVNVTNYVQENPSEAEQARLMKNTMRQMGYDSVY